MYSEKIIIICFLPNNNVKISKNKKYYRILVMNFECIRCTQIKNNLVCIYYNILYRLMSKYDKNITEVIINFNVSNRLYRYSIIIIFLCVFIIGTFLCVYRRNK